jgi:hypothetical protein
MLQAYSFEAEPIVGHAAEDQIKSVRGFIISSHPDPEQFLRDRLAHEGLAPTRVWHTDNPSQERLSHLPDNYKSDLARDEFCMVRQATYLDGREIGPFSN